MLLQSVNFKGDQFSSLRKGFRPLVNYIGAKQKDGTKISIAALVMQALGNDEEVWIISFSMPSKYTKTNLPKTRDKSFSTEELEPSKTAIIKFNGRTDERMLRKKTEVLLHWLQHTD